MNPRDPRICRHCRSTNTEEKKVGPHLGLYCQDCGKWIDWISQNKPLTVMPFGKHQGKKIGDLPDDYLEWGISNISNKKVCAAFEDELRQRKGAAQIVPLVKNDALILKDTEGDSLNYASYGFRKNKK